ncbi:MAG: anthranilate synthase component I family protein [Planctomycetota bacterium]
MPFANPVQILEIEPQPAWPGLVDRLRGAATPFLLESGGDQGGMVKWHFLGGFPVGEARCTGSSWRIDVGGEVQHGDGDPWRAVAAWWKQWGDRPVEYSDDSVPLQRPRIPFLGGAVGQIGYEFGEESLPLEPRPPTDVPSFHMYLYDELVAVEAATGRAFWIHRGRAGQPKREWWRWQAPAVEPDIADSAVVETRLSLQRDDYLRRVEEIRERIRVGDVYEVNLCRCHELSGAPSLWELHARLRQRQPVPYAALLPWEPLGIVSASPECFLRRQGSHVITRPIKGTTPRGATASADAAAARDLLASPKERAELAMIIDLQRNDLGRVCLPGSIVVVEEAALETYSTVIHTVATVAGTVPDFRDPWPLLRAAFPGGSITGAPKIAAMQTIRELEPVPRHAYTGAIGWIGPDGDLDLNIAIRTVLQHGATTTFSVGGAVTWDSDPQQEYLELEAKGRAIRSALFGDETLGGRDAS